MISYLQGQIIDININSATVLNSGIGYQVNMSLSHIQNLELNKEIDLFISTFIRDDKIELFGFETKDHLNLFKKLISVNGVGPKSAMDIISYPIGEVKLFIDEADVKSLTKVKGIGKKTAERIILELKNKLVIEEENNQVDIFKVPQDILDTLIIMGYRKPQIIKAYKTLPNSIQKEDEIMSYLIQNL